MKIKATNIMSDAGNSGGPNLSALFYEVYISHQVLFKIGLLPVSTPVLSRAFKNKGNQVRH